MRLPLTFSRCVRVTHGAPDRPPFTKYEEATVEVELIEVEGVYQVVVDDKALGEGSTKEEAWDHAKSRLTEASRLTLLERGPASEQKKPAE